LDAHHTAGANLIYVRSTALFFLPLAGLLGAAAGNCTPFEAGSSSSSSSSSGAPDAAPTGEAGVEGGTALSDGGDDLADAGLIGVSPPSCSRNAVTGARAVTGLPDNISPGSIDAYGFSITGVLTGVLAHCLWVYITDGIGENIVVAVYENNFTNNTPSNLKARGMITSVKRGWNAAVLDVDVAVNPLQTLWLAAGPVTGDIKLVVNESCGPNQRPLKARINFTPVGELPNPFDQNFSQALCGASIYLAPRQ
jgi:hypothetical protein